MDAEMRLNAAGWIVQDEWTRTAVIRVRVILDAFIVMPNHFHGIILIECRGTLQRAPTLEQFGKPTSDSIPTIIRLFKSATTKRLNALRDTPGIPIWQRNYHEHIIRDESEFNRIREYVINNPAGWDKDEENPTVATGLPLQETGRHIGLPLSIINPNPIK